METYIIKAEDLGFGKAACHDKRLTPLESTFCGFLWVDHSGAKNKISSGDLAVRFAWALTGWRFTLPVYEDEIELWKRRVRKVQNHIIWFHRDIPILRKRGSAVVTGSPKPKQRARPFTTPSVNAGCRVW